MSIMSIYDLTTKCEYYERCGTILAFRDLEEHEQQCRLIHGMCSIPNGCNNRYLVDHNSLEGCVTNLYRKWETTNNELTHKLDEANNFITHVRNENEQLKIQLQQANNEISKLKDDKKELEKRQDENKKIIIDSKNEIMRLSDQTNKLNNELQQEKIEKLELKKEMDNLLERFPDINKKFQLAKKYNEFNKNYDGKFDTELKNWEKRHKMYTMRTPETVRFLNENEKTSVENWINHYSNWSQELKCQMIQNLQTNNIPTIFKNPGQYKTLLKKYKCNEEISWMWDRIFDFFCFCAVDNKIWENMDNLTDDEREILQKLDVSDLTVEPGFFVYYSGDWDCAKD